MAEVIKLAGRIDALVNNAGYSLVGAIEEASLDEARALFETNFFGVLRVTNAVLPVMRRQGAGRVVNVTSVVGFLPAPFMGLYAARKHALEGYSESLDHEVRAFGVRVVLVQPGFTRTNGDSRRLRGIQGYGRPPGVGGVTGSTTQRTVRARVSSSSTDHWS